MHITCTELSHRVPRRPQINLRNSTVGLKPPVGTVTSSLLGVIYITLGLDKMHRDRTTRASLRFVSVLAIPRLSINSACSPKNNECI
ncbi:hypothetical protein P692DRAFT_20786878, partial [Suillus brevipes Sb2]